jgi:hypothetical protein
VYSATVGAQLAQPISQHIDRKSSREDSWEVEEQGALSAQEIAGTLEAMCTGKRHALPSSHQ